jgi:hypothetical protein
MIHPIKSRPLTCERTGDFSVPRSVRSHSGRELVRTFVLLRSQRSYPLADLAETLRIARRMQIIRRNQPVSEFHHER